MPDYPKEQLWELYENLPQELKGIIFSEKTADIIYNSCFRNGVKDREKISEVAKNTGYVLLGLIPPEELQNILKKEIKLKEEVAKKIFSEINRFIFYPVKEILEKLYETEIDKEIKTAPLKEKPQTKKSVRKRDKYREPIEGEQDTSQNQV